MDHSWEQMCRIPSLDRVSLHEDAKQCIGPSEVTVFIQGAFEAMDGSISKMTRSD